MICPNCSEDVAMEPIMNGIGVCPKCLRTIVVADNRLATANDTAVLSDTELAKLRKARAALRAAL